MISTLQPLFSIRRQYLAIGTTPLWPVHKVFGSVESSVAFGDTRRLDTYLTDLAEGMGRPFSQARPIVDGALADGSRINIIYSEGSSVGGSSFTIRKFSDVPTAVTQLIAWGTFDATLGAPLWQIGRAHFGTPAT